MEVELVKLRNTLYEYIDWICPKLLELERWVSDQWSELRFAPGQIELALL